MSRTASSIILGALRLLKVKEAGEALSADGSELEDGLIALNDLLDEWSTQGYMQTNKVQLTTTLVPGQSTYTYGSGGDNSTRPVRITKAWIRDSNNLDFPLDIVSNDVYNDIFNKTLQSDWAGCVYFREEYPLTVANIYPVPNTAYTLYVESWATLGTITLGSDTVDLAPGYISALMYNLAIQISPEYKDPSPIVSQIAAQKLAWIKRVNSNDRPKMVSGLEKRFFFTQSGRNLNQLL